MESIISTGIRGEGFETVSHENTAKRYGSGLVDVYATPAMIALMETTAMRSIHPLLTNGMTSVGTEVNVKHLRASAIGELMRCESRVTEVQGRKVVFEVSVWDDELLIGHGTHTRFIVDEAKFMAQLNT